MSLPKRLPPLGAGSASMSLGSKDPRRAYRNHQAPLGALAKREPFGVDDKGRQTLNRKVKALPSTASTAELIEAMKEAGIMDR